MTTSSKLLSSSLEIFHRSSQFSISITVYNHIGNLADVANGILLCLLGGHHRRHPGSRAPRSGRPCRRPPPSHRQLWDDWRGCNYSFFSWPPVFTDNHGKSKWNCQLGSLIRSDSWVEMDTPGIPSSSTSVRMISTAINSPRAL